ncbi:hypothetical protein [Alteromonas sp. C1M14]|uniref:hypothetical protein n=1 Tax=Alteromonas sp. C1M14 TaxID=2841567 RepID=UPI001C0A11D5|nr:hypothetical protein [Alteromonas sp. C1M14]MBU2976908.1 hypothetical protein [Alteromonas sp. C1M14]
MLAVITGDLVNSTKLSTEQYQYTISTLTGYLETIGTTTLCDFALYRGDGYQIVFTDPTYAAAHLLQLKLFLNSQLDGLQVDCTQSLAYGEGTHTKGNPGISSGDVFIRSGRRLEDVKSGEFTFSMPNDDSQEGVDIMCHQLSYIINRLSKKQCKLVYQYLVLDFPLHQVLADNEGTTRQNISERLRAAGADLLKPFIHYINQRINK